MYFIITVDHGGIVLNERIPLGGEVAREKALINTGKPVCIFEFLYRIDHRYDTI